MNRFGWWLIPVVLVALLIGGGIGAAVADHHEPYERGIQITTAPNTQTGEPAQVIKVEGDGHWGRHGFFPFGFLLFPLLWIGVIWLVFGAFWRRGRGRWDGRFEDWHRRQHESDGPGRNPPGSGTVTT
jgi:hypothetical protein